MTNLKKEKVFYENGSICVTAQTLSTRFKDETLAPVQSVVIGRDPLWMAAVVALGLLLCANRFGDLLYWYEQVWLGVIGITVAAIGYCTATLRIGQHMRERVVLVAPIWTINAVRHAIAEARRENTDKLAQTIISEDYVG